MLNNHKDISDVDYKETGLNDGVLSKTNEPKAKGIGNRLLDKFNKTITSFRVEKKGPNGKWRYDSPTWVTNQFTHIGNSY